MVAVPAPTRVFPFATAGQVTTPGVGTVTNNFDNVGLIVLTTMVLISSTAGAGNMYITTSGGIQLVMVTAPTVNTTYTFSGLAWIMNPGDTLQVHNTSMGTVNYGLYGYINY